MAEDGVHQLLPEKVVLPGKSESPEKDSTSMFGGENGAPYSFSWVR